MTYDLKFVLTLPCFPDTVKYSKNSKGSKVHHKTFKHLTFYCFDSISGVRITLALHDTTDVSGPNSRAGWGKNLWLDVRNGTR